MYNSYIQIDKELEEFVLDTDLRAKDYMAGADISWVAQVKPFIEQFSKKGDLVFDPFAGLGTTLLGAGLTGRRSIGIEIDRSRFGELEKRVTKYRSLLSEQPELICGDALQTEYPKEVDLIVTNFPYFHATPIYDKGNIYSIGNYQVYLKMIEAVILKCKSALKKDGYMLVFTENIRLPNGNMVPQAYDICKLLQKHFNLKEEHIVLYQKPNIAVDDATYTNRSHEYVYIAKQKHESLNMEIFRSALDKINNSVEYVTIGTYALNLHPEGAVLDNPPADLDIFVADADEAIKIAQILTSDNYDIFSWEDKIDNSFDKNILKGRYYIRATKKINSQIYKIDINYESDAINYNQLYRNSCVINNIRVADINSISILLKDRNSDKDKSLLFKIEQYIRNHS